MTDMFNIPQVSGTFSWKCARNPGNVKHVAILVFPEIKSASVSVM